MDTMEFCRALHMRHFISNAALERLAIERSAAFVSEPPQSVECLLQSVTRSLAAREPFSLIRVGNGEGNAYGMTLPLEHDAIFSTFRAEFDSQNHSGIDVETARAFSLDVIQAIDNANMVGVRFFRFDENALIEKFIEERNSYAALGLSYARQYFRLRLEEGRMLDKSVTSAWVHLDLIDRLDDLLALGDKVIVISGRERLSRAFAERLGDRLVSFLPVPAQGFVPTGFSESHFGHRFGEICRFLQRDLSGHLVLVGAGLFGKIYCDLAARRGAVALDLGSLFDVLCGLRTRPVFNRYNFANAAWI